MPAFALFAYVSASQVYSVNTKRLTVKDKLHGDTCSPLATHEHDKLLSDLSEHVFDSHEERMEAGRQERLRQQQRLAERRAADAIRQQERARAEAEAEHRRKARKAEIHRRKSDLLRASIVCEQTGAPSDLVEGNKCLCQRLFWRSFL